MQLLQIDKEGERRAALRAAPPPARFLTLVHQINPLDCFSERLHELGVDATHPSGQEATHAV